ncbi:MAG: glycosyltransferase [Tepidisphaeraceae bacterium]|jgi:processive 1,2-diacylglycerol beta-glucosyltransferase
MMPMTPDFHGQTAEADGWRGAKPRIAILSASVGAGHVRAAQAIESALGELLPDATIAHVDALDLTNGAFRRAYGAGYFRAVERAPRFVGWMYDFLDHPNDRGAATRTRQLFERLNFTRLTRLLTEHPWDLAICTHFLPAALLARLRRRELVQFPHAVVVTDFDVHGMWITRPCERFFVATQEAKANLAALQVEDRDIRVTGIPIDPRFNGALDRGEAIARNELAADRPIVLQLAGGFGIGSIERIHRSICQIERPLQIVVVTGRNSGAAEALTSVDHHPRHRRKILGYTMRMHELLRAADVVVTKPGGLTTAESLASGCPMVIAEPIPGQEDRNADFLLENGCAIKVNNLSSLTYKLSSLLEDSARLERMRAAATRCARPGAAHDVAASCVQLLQHHPVLV